MTSGYPGEYAEIDSETGFNHFTLRDYDARIGRWTKFDPFNQYFSPYIGMGNNPVSLVDPWGGSDVGPLSSYFYLIGLTWWSISNYGEETVLTKTGLRDGGWLMLGSFVIDNNSIVTSNDVGGLSLGNFWIHSSSTAGGIGFSNAVNGSGPSGPGAGYSSYSGFITSATNTSTHFSNNANNPSGQGGNWFSDAYNSGIGRIMAPDFLAIGVGFNGIVGVGGATSIEFRWVTHGPEASWKPMITVTQSVGLGFSVDATINFEAANYVGNVNNMTRSMMQTSSLNGDYPTFWAAGGVSAGGKIGDTGYVTPNVGGSFIIGGELNLGLPAGPLPANGAGGVSNTWILYDFYN